VPSLLRSRSRHSARNHDGAQETNAEPKLEDATDKKGRSVAFGNLPSHTEGGLEPNKSSNPRLSNWQSPMDWAPIEGGDPLSKPPTPDLRNLNSPWYNEKAEAGAGMDYFSMVPAAQSPPAPDHASHQAPIGLPEASVPSKEKHDNSRPRSAQGHSEISGVDEHRLSLQKPTSEPEPPKYTDFYRSAPAKTYWQTLRPFSGRLCHDNWLRVAFRPFVLYAYPAILWSSVVYSLSVGWLIVLSESVSLIYKNHESYNFTSLQTGLVYLSPFIGGILGTAVAGKVSDVIVRFMSRRNGGVYEPEYRLVMAIPITLTTAIGLMGFGWSAQERDNWIVPTVFFGVISFGCSLGSTTAITFAVDSYRVYAGEALVTLNFSKSRFTLPHRSVKLSPTF
jgi:hypothetical protein